MAARVATRRLLREFESWRADQEEFNESRQKATDAIAAAEATGNEDDIAAAKEAALALEENNPDRGIERLGPAADGDDLFKWEAVLNGRGNVGGGYDDGRWLVSIQLPAAYPNQPPVVSFVTPIMHANVHATTGEVCLDLLKTAWTPALTVVSCMRAVRMLLSNPGTDSPLNIDLAALLRAGDTMAAARLVQLWCEEKRYEGV
ncbi:E2 ubiquitin-protein ligase peroxin 4 [Sporothrix bragantina]|uniref:E2 ubiquitin-protein ligase peroxin 4 n=1 Tax=Sporothrix bragantina TaxID=671064 RepID=A0ABP0AVD4_9PEZI